MRAAPRRPLHDFDGSLRRMFSEKRAVVDDAREVVLFDVMQCVSERHLAVAMMMSVRLAVSGDVHDLRMCAFVLECPDQSIGEILAAREKILERDGARDRTVVEKDFHRAARRQRAAIRRRRIDAALGATLSW